MYIYRKTVSCENDKTGDTSPRDRNIKIKIKIIYCKYCVGVKGGERVTDTGRSKKLGTAHYNNIIVNYTTAVLEKKVLASLKP